VAALQAGVVMVGASAAEAVMAVASAAVVATAVGVAELIGCNRPSICPGSTHPRNLWKIAHVA
jgi:hypothetical protein